MALDGGEREREWGEERGRIGKIERGETGYFFGLGHLLGYLHYRCEYPYSTSVSKDILIVAYIADDLMDPLRKIGFVVLAA